VIKLSDVKSNQLKQNLSHDVSASVVVFLVALPLCLGIALASGVPLFSGLIAGIVGGIVIGSLSKSSLSVSGPAAGLTVIVLSAVEKLPTLEVFFLAVFLSGIVQMLLGVARAGVIGDFIPNSVIRGMLAAIGLILILKQIPHAVGYDVDPEGDFTFKQEDGGNTFTTLVAMFDYLSFGALTVSAISLTFLFWWDWIKAKRPGFIGGFLKQVPGPLLVVIFGILVNRVVAVFFPVMKIDPQHLVNVPVSGSLEGFIGQFRFPDFSYIGSQDVWIVAVTLAVVASVETLLSIEAVDKLDPLKRVTPTNRELIAQGVGNLTSGLIGGMPVTSVIVRSSANVNSGARTKLSAIIHGVLLLVSVLVFPEILNMIPLSCLAAILIAVGYKLTRPELFVAKYKKGWAHLIPFVVTILAILFTDLLVGIGIGLVVSMLFIVRNNFRSSIFVFEDGQNLLVRIKKDLSFLHKYELKKILSSIPDGTSLMLDFSRVSFVDLDNTEIINDFMQTIRYRNISVRFKFKDKSQNLYINDKQS
jgi:carbonic anhydrase